MYVTPPINEYYSPFYPIKKTFLTFVKNNFHEINYTLF